MTKTKTTIAYKAFDDDWTCLGFQYEVGKTYTHDGEISICSAGFHGCENPLDVLTYYPLVGSKFAEVEMTGDQIKHDEDSKICAAEITIKAEISIGEMTRQAVAWIAKTAKKKTPVYCARATTGDSAHAATRGDGAHAATSGGRAHAVTSGYWAHAATSGYWAHAATSGDRAHAATSGYWAHAATSGDRAHAATSGDGAHAATSGDRAHAATSGNDAHAATSGYWAHAATSGDRAHAATSGDGAHAATTGNRAHAATTGNCAHAATTGKNSIASALGRNSTAKAEIGGAIDLAAYDDDGNLVCVRSAMVGEEGVEPGKTYRLTTDRQFEEVK